PRRQCHAADIGRFHLDRSRSRLIAKQGRSDRRERAPAPPTRAAEAPVKATTTDTDRSAESVGAGEVDPDLAPNVVDRPAGDTVALASRGLSAVLEMEEPEAMLSAADLSGHDRVDSPDVGGEHAVGCG